MEFDAKWGGQHPAISKLWSSAWSEFVPILDWDVEIRRIICSERDRVAQRPISPRRPSSRSLPERRRRAEVSLTS